MAKTTIKIATMTTVGRMALRRRPTRRLLKLSSLLNRSYGTLVVSATTKPVRAVPRYVPQRHSCQRMRLRHSELGIGKSASFHLHSDGQPDGFASFAAREHH